MQQHGFATMARLWLKGASEITPLFRGPVATYLPEIRSLRRGINAEGRTNFHC